MEPSVNNSVESHPLFPSGDWEGFYLYRWSGFRHMMAFTLDFREGTVSGHGCDDIAPFNWSGIYDVDQLRCRMTKHYATHTVEYDGYVDENGIWGTWTIGQGFSGGFHLWPKPGFKKEETAEALSEALTLDAALVLTGV